MDSSSQIPKTKFKIMFIYSIALFSIFIAHNIFVEFIYIHKLNVGGQVFPSINRLKVWLGKMGLPKFVFQLIISTLQHENIRLCLSFFRSDTYTTFVNDYKTCLGLALSLSIFKKQPTLHIPQTFKEVPKKYNLSISYLKSNLKKKSKSIFQNIRKYQV